KPVRIISPSAPTTATNPWLVTVSHRWLTTNGQASAATVSSTSPACCQRSGNRARSLAYEVTSGRVGTSDPLHVTAAEQAIGPDHEERDHHHVGEHRVEVLPELAEVRVDVG